jgi:hypothetical protein
VIFLTHRVLFHNQIRIERMATIVDPIKYPFEVDGDLIAAASVLALA